MSQRFYGSINLTKILDAAKEKHSAFVKAENGNIYCNISAWLNDEPDQFDNIMSIKLAAKKEHLEKEPEAGKIYIGNCKEAEETTKAINSKDADAISTIANDLPF